MLSLPLEKKWQIWTTRRGTEQADTNLSNNPEDYTNRLRDLAMVNRIRSKVLVSTNRAFQLQFPSTGDELVQRCRSLHSLQIALRTQPHSFVSRFMEAEGLNCLLSLLAGLDWDTAQSDIHTVALGCVKALMNNSVRFV